MAASDLAYWQHRIWPKDNVGSKPPLDEVMSQAQIQRKVQDYLRNSQVLEDSWHRPISAQELQTEMDRIAQHTKRPEMLRELFAALGDDPFVIAECLARPVLAKRAVTDLYADDQKRSDSPVSGRDWTASQTTAEASSYKRPEVVVGGCVDDTWTATTNTNVPDGRTVHTAVWTGAEMIVWGGYDGNSYVNTGGKYGRTTDSWIGTSTTNAPDGRYAHTAVWTGISMIVWGGKGNITFLNTGGRYDPVMDSWTATSTTDAPDPRYFHTAVWTGSEMIVWGGVGETGLDLNTGGRYNPDTNSWTATNMTNAPDARDGHTAVWTSSEMIVWGGYSDLVSGPLNTGSRYNPTTDTWIASSTANAPTARTLHTAVWADSEMIVWGGTDLINFFNSGGRYDPVTDSWTATSALDAPEARDQHTAVLTGTEMIVWGGTDGINFLNSGGRYDPSTDSWTATSTTNAPEARIYHTAVSTSSEMIVWGGRDESFTRLDTGGKYCVGAAGPTPTATATPTPTPTPTPCTGRCSPTPRPRPTAAPRPTPR